MLGTRLGSYEIIEEVGRGGMARVFRAYQPSVDRYVAIKVIEKNLSNDPLGVERFQREARLIARLEHVHILPVYDFDGANVPPYIVMRYLDGGTLKDILTRGQLPLSDIAYLFRQIASALDYAHRQGIIHRDIKPSNIMIDREGNAFVSDFGIARVVTTSGEHSSTASGVIVGTPDYMAPEQVMGSTSIDQRADVYALGVMLFQMVANQLPFEGDSAFDLMMKHMNAPVPSAVALNPALPDDIDLILTRAMEKDPAERYPSVAMLASDVLALAGGMSANVQVKRAAGETSQIIVQRREAQKEQINLTLVEFKKQRLDTASQSTPTEHNQLVTALYLNIAEYAALLAEVDDAESSRASLMVFWKSIKQAIQHRGGKVFDQGNTSLLALWGSDTSHEDDAVNAIFTALAIQSILRAQTANLLEAAEMLPVKIGINTGLALLTPTDTGDYSASGAAILVANKLSDQADGAILITQDTFRPVQGIFDMHIDVPLKVRGRNEPLPIYRVVAAKVRAFRLEARGVYGVETAMIGRKGELEQMQDAFEEAIEESETHVFTVIGAPGMGKSRLLYELARWGDLHQAEFRIFRGRATSSMTQRPYAMLRDVLSFRFEILDSDPLPVVRQKLEAGITDLTGVANDEMAHLIGHLIGFDLSDSPPVKALVGDPAQIVARGRALLKKLITLTAKILPVVFQLEDVHLADESSLVWLNELVDEAQDLPLMVLFFARPDLLGRLPDWGVHQKFHKRLTLEPLSKRESRLLVAEVLKRLPEVPVKLRDQLVDSAEGNPFFIEETVKMLIEDHVIVIEGTNWRVEESRVDHLRVPPTLFALLQARLDTLLYPEKLALQRASVVGRIFYDTPLAAMNGADENPLDDLPTTLQTLAVREFIYRRQNSAFAGSAEYIFAQNMLRDAIYSALLKRQLKTYHTATAEWLVSTAGDRLDEYLSLIAEHYEKGGNQVQAAAYLRRAGEQAINQGAYREARHVLEKALSLLPGDRPAERMRTQRQLGEVLRVFAEFDAARATLHAALDTARSMYDSDAQADALNQLSLIAVDLGQYHEALAYLEAAEPLARAGNPRTLGWVLYGFANAHFRLGRQAEARKFGEEGLTLARDLGDAVLEVTLLNRLGTSYGFDDPARSAVFLQEGLTLAQQIGHRDREAGLLINLGFSATLAKDYQAAIGYTRLALATHREIGNWGGVMYCLVNLAQAHITLDEVDIALSYLVELIRTARRLGTFNMLLLALSQIGNIQGKRGDLAAELAYKGAVLFHPSLSGEDRTQLEQELAAIRTEQGLSEAEVQVRLEAGRALDVDTVIDAFLREHSAGT